MNPKQIGQAYDQITGLWEKPEFNLNNGIDAHVKAIELTQSRGLALDIGCGLTGRFIHLLKQQGFTPSGLDVSKKMLDIARHRMPEISFIEADICTYSMQEEYDFISAWDSIWHIPLSEQKAVLTKIVDSLNPNGVFILSFGGVDEAGDHVDDFMGPQVYYSSLGTSGFLSLFIELNCQIKHLEFDQYPELHAYMIVQKQAV
ncbi:class I SAM-dependent methyltransferase [Vibrio ulleungensis]|uniref:Class I SAM-dependent methyltransferase n=1 Tax=Vibrio ulleungensis TaxID=2807619 RepID=A0ABS2HDH0_9VIBR|nr:class I SAM-dependent methyltransferase [Vibrio ulleungensis]MBM7035044.1 class I SAM-dependent methyltransferase [Vibrio ulleungensis]